MGRNLYISSRTVRSLVCRYRDHVDAFSNGQRNLRPRISSTRLCLNDVITHACPNFNGGFKEVCP